MELKDYSDMYDGMRMSDEMDERIKSAVFKQQERTDHTMKKFNGNTAVQSESFSLIDLPDTITLEVKNLYEGEGFELKFYGTFDVKLAK
jgi:hypothetical protein